MFDLIKGILVNSKFRNEHEIISSYCKMSEILIEHNREKDGDIISEVIGIEFVEDAQERYSKKIIKEHFHVEFVKDNELLIAIGTKKNIESAKMILVFLRLHFVSIASASKNKPDAYLKFYFKLMSRLNELKRSKVTENDSRLKEFIDNLTNRKPYATFKSSR